MLIHFLNMYPYLHITSYLSVFILIVLTSPKNQSF
uniref:Uncharacterized protein n=1 Tax=Arundo donax TaxID=35708 RepID=A0A0A9A9V9_ARUDO